ncbi:hypothetical protein QFZ37_000643 [Chryseobacterium ginsenosidimutans]|uniref:glycine-rich domain-containing protein n=1 Tax=Chryseobacterium ginsenosidimutans TaxID=687846 RepID=UPI002784CED1|nr:hypothetical protein [Chryseobacterium ginsenosidimutans]MDQ0592274.1 hypothetical protein [Chryseobacterium ginsenosidimutans]
METKTLLQNDLLWSRLQGFSLDCPNVDFPFSKKLAKEEKWTLDFTAKAIDEYKKFVYLCCILPNGASPSEIVDKVWHMHLIYTQNYWEEFCPNILQQKLHHLPSKGGLNEIEKHENWFLDTLKSYKEIFQEKAPEDIWLNKKETPKQRKSWLNIGKVFSFISIIFILSSCSDDVSDLMSTVFILIILVFGLIGFLFKIFNGNNDPKNQNKNDGGNSSSGGSCSGGGSGCSSSCGSSCGGGGCGGCGGS